MAKQPDTTESDTPAEQLVSVKIIKDGHEHDGKQIAVGTSIDVDQATANWLREHKIIEG